MMIAGLHRQMAVLDAALHRDWKIHQPAMDWSVAAPLNALFVAAAEFADVCRDYAILFVPAGTDAGGKPLVAPIVALGLQAQENLYLQGTQWRAAYHPVLLRAYPFAVGPGFDAQQAPLCIDTAWGGWSRSEGLALFDADGRPSEHVQAMGRQLEQFELEVQRTREFGRILLDKGLLREMRFDAELPEGGKLAVDGFLAVDDKSLAELADADLIEMQRNGILRLVHAHLLSLGHLRKLVQWRLQAQAAAQAAAAAPS